MEMSCNHPNVRQASKCQASTQLPDRNPMLDQAPICHNALKYVTMLPNMPQCLQKYVTFGPTFLIFFFAPKLLQKGLQGPGGLGAPQDTIPLIFSLFFTVFSPSGGPHNFSFYAAVISPPISPFKAAAVRCRMAMRQVTLLAPAAPR